MNHSIIRNSISLLAAFFFPAFLAAQPVISLEEVMRQAQESGEENRIVTTFADQSLGSFSVDTTSREETRLFFNSIYNSSEGVDMEWTGDYAAILPNLSKGDTSEAFKLATLLRVNFFRAMAGIQANITFLEQLNEDAQFAALIMSGNDTLSHDPSDDDANIIDGLGVFPNFLSTVGDEAAGVSNLAIGQSGPDSITGYMQDAGAGNFAAGHRRWIIFPPSTEMGTGDVPGGAAPESVLSNIETFLGSRPQGDVLREANALYIFPDSLQSKLNDPRPEQVWDFVSYPAPGYVPYQLVFPRWSFSADDDSLTVDFSSATVTMTRDGQNVPVSIEQIANNIGDSTLVWVYDNLNPNVSQHHPKPGQDVVYEITVSGVKFGPLTQPDFNYTVTVFDPDVAGGDYEATTVSGSAQPLTGLNNAYTVSRPAFDIVSGIRWRSFQSAAYNAVEGAEAGLGTIVANTSGDYNPVSGDFSTEGNSSFHLGSGSLSSTDSITLPQIFKVGANGAINFDSMFRIGTDTQFAKVQVSVDGGVNWLDVYSRQGGIPQGQGGSFEELVFTARSASLTDYVDRTVRIRFAWIHTGGTGFVTGAADTTGWYIDNISFTGLEALTDATVVTSDHQTVDTFNFAPTAEGNYGLQAQAMLFDIYPLEWSPVFATTAISGTNAPPVGIDDESNITEGQASSAGNVLSNDTDANPDDVLTVTQVNDSAANVGIAVLTDHGAITISSDGNFEFTLDNEDAAVIALNTGQTLVNTITYQVSDGKDGLSTATLSITINGLDDVPDVVTSLVNISTRGFVGTQEEVMIAGFVIAGTQNLDVVLRALGPTLALRDGVSGVLPNPKISIFSANAGAFILTNNSWEDNADTASLEASFTRVGAEPILDANDAAVKLSLEPGTYALFVDDEAGGSGIGLVEAFDETFQFGGSPESRLMNISTRAVVGQGEKTMIAGFSVQGNEPLKILAQAVGPGIAGEVSNPIPDPQISIFDLSAGQFITSANNDNWQDGASAAEISTVAPQIGARVLAPGSLDAASIAVLQPGGNFAVFVSDTQGREGIAVVEVFAVYGQ